MTKKPIRIWRVPGMVFGPRELETGLEAMTPDMLARIRDAGLTGVWAMVRLRDAVRTDVFPELGVEAERQQEILRELAVRCKEAGLRLYLHLNEPRGFPASDPFWTAHPGIRGAPSPSPNDEVFYGWLDSYAMCTSAPATLAWLEQACADLFRQVPNLGGVECITMSEHTTHCYAHFASHDPTLGEHFGQQSGDALGCARCRNRHPETVVREVLAAIEHGVHSVSPDAAVIAWTWSWDMLAPPPQGDLIASLPRSIIIMPDIERGGELQYQGVVERVDEYSLNYVGPSPRARGQFEAARQSGKRAMARLQINTTTEYFTAPNWPLIANLYRKLSNLRDLDITDIMAAWCFGYDLDTVNAFALARFSSGGLWGDEGEFLECVAREYFGLTDGRAVADAWRGFSRAAEPFPFGFGILYLSPFAMACAYPLPNHEPRTRPMGIWNFEPDYVLGDMLEQCLEPYGLETIVERFDVMQQTWRAAVADYAQALREAVDLARARRELNTARFFGHLAHSAWVLFSWLAWRYHPGAVPGLDTTAMRARLEAEQHNLDQAATVLESDSRLGFLEEFNRHCITPDGVRAKRDSDRDLAGSELNI